MDRTDEDSEDACPPTPLSDGVVREIYNSVNDAIFVHDPETGEILDVNETMCEMYGYTRAEARGLSIGDLSSGVPPYTQDTAVEYVRKAVEGDPQVFDWCAKDSEGDYFWVEVSMRRAVVDDQALVLVTVRDITERKTHEQVLEHLHATNRELLEAQSPDEIASITCDAATEVLDLPLIGVHFYDADADALVPVAWSDALASVLDGDPPPIPADEGLAWRAYLDGETYSYPDVRETEGVLDTATPFRSELHLPLGEHGVFILGSTAPDDFDGNDRTLAHVLAANVEAALDRVARERALTEERNKLAETTEELEALNRVVRHDIRNDMAIVLGWAEMLEAHVDADGAEYLRKVLASGEHVVELTEVARDYIETLTSEDDLAVSPTPLRPILETELDLRRESFPHAEFLLEGTVPDVEVTANEMLGAVFRNLLNNAVQHNDAADPFVTVSCETDGDTVVVRIADNGPGIPADQKNAIFRKGDKGIDSSGSGIGLYLVQTLITQYNGSVAVADNDPEGAVFTVRLPKAE